MPKQPHEIGLDELLPDAHNANRGTMRGTGMLDVSLEEYGAGRSILVDGANRIIAGNKTHEAAARKGFRAKVVDIAPDEILVARRADLDLTQDDGRARGLATADNRVAQENLDWEWSAVREFAPSAADMFWFPEEAEELAIAEALEEAAQASDAADDSETNPEPPNRKRSTVVIVVCKDETEQALVTEVCDQNLWKWRIP